MTVAPRVRRNRKRVSVTGVVVMNLSPVCPGVASANTSVASIVCAAFVMAPVSTMPPSTSSISAVPTEKVVVSPAARLAAVTRTR